jgi:ATP-dependent DNA ligase
MTARFIPPQHPKAGISCNRESIEKIIKLGWIAQKKIDGARAQIHISHMGDIVAFTRKGTRHTVTMQPEIILFLLEHYRPEKDWNVIDCEWLRYKGKLFIFDVLKWNGESLSGLTYLERYNMLFEKPVITKHCQILSMIKTFKKCMSTLEKEPELEGLVFKAITTRGWPNTAIIRCRQK